MKTILLVDHHGVRGAGRKLYRILAEAAGYRYVLAIPSRWPDGYIVATAEPEKSGLEVIPLRPLFAGKPHRGLYRGLTGLIRNLRPDVLYVDAEPEGFLAFQAVHAARRSSTPVGVVFDSWRNIDYGPSEFPFKFPRFAARIERYVLKDAIHGIVHNHDAAAIFARKGFSATTVLPPWVDTTMFVPQERVRAEAGAGFVVGFVGRLVPEKGVKTLLSALRELPPEFRLLIVGEGPERDALKYHAGREGVSSRVQWEKGVVQEKLPALFGRMDALVLPSLETPGWKEQFGRVLIEAMSCGVPVVGSDTGEIPRVIDDCGLVVPPGDPEALARSLLRLAHDRELHARYVWKGRERAVNHFDLRVIAAAYSRLFRSLSADMEIAR